MYTLFGSKKVYENTTRVLIAVAFMIIGALLAIGLVL
jgi:hypothetical protein